MRAFLFQLQFLLIPYKFLTASNSAAKAPFIISYQKFIHIKQNINFINYLYKDIL